MKIQGFEWLSQTPFGNLIGFIALVVGIISLVLFFIYKNTIGLSAQYKTIPLIEPDSHGILDGLEIKYNEIYISQLALTQVFLWNSGNQTIDANRNVIDDPLRITFDKDTKIIKAKIVAETRPVNKTSIKLSNNNVYIDYDFFDSKDGIRIDILHTGKELFPVIGGTIKGMPTGVKIVSKRSQVTKKMPSDWLSLISLDYYLFASWFCLFLAMLPYGFFNKFLANSNLTVEQFRKMQLGHSMFGLVLFIVWFLSLHYSSALDHYPRILETNSYRII